MMGKVLVAMSGGVDSSLACLLLKKKGYQCIGATIKTWPKESCGDSKRKICCSLDAISHARNVANKLKIPHYVFDFSEEFRKKIKNYFISEYKKGRTPNPCIFCNSEIKFGLLFKKARELGCNFIGSGHYAKISKRDKYFVLKKGRDRIKDQSYFLFNLRQDKLKSILFPLGNMTKDKARKKAKRAGLISHDKASSQDICFEFEKSENQGNIIFKDGKVIGTHKGILNYTIGQRKGLGVAYKEPLYVIKIDADKNIVYAGTRNDAYKKALIAENINWIKDKPVKKTMRVKAKIRYGSKEAWCRLKPISDERAEVIFEKPQFAPTPGQAIVFYVRDEILGGGWIKEVND